MTAIPQFRINVQHHTLPILFVMMAMGASLLLASYWENQTPFYLFLIAIVFSALVGGMKSGINASVLSTLAGWFYFTSTKNSFTLNDSGHALDLLLFFLLAILASWVISEWIQMQRDLAHKSNALHESEDRFRKITDMVPAMVFMTDDRGEWTLLNQTLLDFFGNKPTSMAPRLFWLSHIHEEDRCMVSAQFSTPVVDFEARRFKCRIKDADGDFRLFLVHMKPRYEAGRFNGYIGAMVDLTDRSVEELSSSQLDKSPPKSMHRTKA